MDAAAGAIFPELAPGACIEADELPSGVLTKTMPPAVLSKEVTMEWRYFQSHIIVPSGR